jgi:hypothetical protein
MTRNYSNLSNKYFNKLYYRFFWNDTLRFILESYQPIVLLSLKQVFGKELVWDNWVSTFINVFDIVSLTIYIAAPVLMTLYFRRNHRKFRKPSFKRRFGDIIEGLSSKRKSSPLFFSIFCYRRLLSCLFIVLFVNRPNF